MERSTCPPRKNYRTFALPISSPIYRATDIISFSGGNMIVVVSVFIQLFVVSQALTSHFIRDYFIYKRVTRVVGFSCGNVDDDFQIFRLLNNAKISVSIKVPDSEYDFNTFLSADFWTLGVFVDLRCSTQNSSYIFDRSSDYRMYDSVYNWLILTESFDETVAAVNDTYFSVVTDFIISVSSGERYDLYDVYNRCKIRGGALNVTKFGTWEINNGLNVTLQGDKLPRRWNFQGMKLNVSGIIQHRPENMALPSYLQDESTKVLENWSKFGYSVMLHVADILNFTIHLTELTRWEKNDTNGPFMNGLRRGDIDLGYYPGILTKDRLDYGRVIIQAWPLRTCFMFRSPPSKKMKISMIFGPFATDTWHMIALFAIVAIIVMGVILRLQDRGTVVRTTSDYGVSVLITVAAICQQGVSSVPDSMASRIAFLHIVVFGLLVYNYYSGAIVSARLNEPMDKMNDSLYSLVNSKMKLATEQIVFFNFLLRDPRPDVQYFNKYWSKIPESKKILGLDDGIRNVTKGNFAYHADPNDAYPYIDRYFDEQMVCQLTEVHLLQPCEMGLWTSRNGQFLEVTKIGLMKIASTGLRKRQVKRWSSKKPHCQKDGILLASVTIYEAAPIMILLLFGMTLSIIICVFENAIFYSLEAKSRRSSVGVMNNNKSTSNLQRITPRGLIIKNKSLANIYYR